MEQKPTLLIIDDETTYRQSMARLLEQRGYRVVHVDNGQSGLQALTSNPVSLVLLDYLLPGQDGISVLKEIKERYPDLPVLLMTAHSTIESAVEAMRLGAVDYLTKTTKIEETLMRIEKTLEMEGIRDTLAYFKQRERGRDPLEQMVGEAPSMRQLKEQLQTVAKSPDTTVLITGESGTGKEVAARIIHALSPRRDKPLMEIDCAAIPAGLLESELFGHERGAFTGADSTKKGLFEIARDGTMLLDEIGDMDPALQSKLLRVLQEKTFKRVGGLRPIRMDARIIAMTNRDLPALIREKRFREDLYYRLQVFQIPIPPLRERREDIPRLAQRFIHAFNRGFRKRVQRLSQDSLAALERYPFAGNIRELRNLIEQAMILAEPAAAELSLSLPAASTAPGTPSTTSAAQTQAIHLSFLPGQQSLEDLEKQLIQAALAQSQGHMTKAAALLGMSRYALTRRLKKWNVH